MSSGSLGRMRKLKSRAVVSLGCAVTFCGASIGCTELNDKPSGLKITVGGQAGDATTNAGAAGDPPPIGGGSGGHGRNSNDAGASGGGGDGGDGGDRGEGGPPGGPPEGGAGGEAASPVADACLSELMSSAGALGPPFSGETSVYTVTVPFSQTSVTVSATPCDPLADVEQTPPNPVTLEVGETSVAITVTASNGSKRAYAITFTRTQEESWTPLGDPTYFDHFVLDPIDPQRIYAGYANGVYKTVDGGDHWTEVRLFTADIVRAMEIDPGDNDIVYIGVSAVGTGGTGVYRSESRGNTWTQLLDDASVSALAIDPSDTEVIYAGTVGGTFAGDAQGVLKSVNSGTSWEPMNLGLASLDIVDLQVHPVDTQTLYTSTADGLYRSDNGSETWFSYGEGLPDNAHVLRLAFDPQSPSTMFATTQGDGVFKSEDGGGTWFASNAGITVLTAADIVVHPSRSSYVYAATDEGVFRSADGGAVWTLIASDAVFWTGDVGVLGISPANPTMLYALFSSSSTGARIYRRGELVE
jgi:photosystem II stability/assembly factor-like uncharacterized protein